MKLIDAANEIMEELEWTARTAARGERLTTAQRTAIRLVEEVKLVDVQANGSQGCEP